MNDTANKITFKYPEKLSTSYISTTDWPPKVQIENGPFVCTDAGEETSQAGATVERTIGGKQYCVTTVSEGAAGSMYSQYAYATELQGKVYFLTFTLRFVQCGNYSDPQKTACEKERASFNIDPIINEIVKTIAVK